MPVHKRKYPGYLMASMVLALSLFTVQAGAGELNIESIEVSTANWEGNGYYSKINKDGSYLTYFSAGGIRENGKRTGRVNHHQLKELVEFIEGLNFFSLKDFYGGYKASRSGFSVRLKIVSDQASKSVNFYLHRDGTQGNYPEGLSVIIQRIDDLINGKSDDNKVKKGS